jgi:antitoxin HigA-1
MTRRQFQGTGLRLQVVTGRVNIISAATINGGSASSGATELRAASRSSIIDSEVNKMANEDRLPPIHPGEILREEFLSPLGMSAHQLAMALRVPATRINDIVNEKRGITADTALSLPRYFGTTARFWMNMQAMVDWGHCDAHPRGKRLYPPFFGRRSRRIRNNA